MLFAEHTGCDFSSNNYENTRTTLASWPVNLLMWNMPYHALHHSNPGLPFHAMPAAHALLAPRVKHISPGYWTFTKAYLRNPMMAAR
jgi:fatty acid desaturase